MKLNLLYSKLKADFDEIEQELEKAIQSDNALLQHASTQLLKAGGKRIRPIFVLLSAKFGYHQVDHVRNAAVALELIHMASLVHDDVIDEADMRRGQPTINYTWNNRIAMYTGDYILARSLEYMTKLDHPVAHQTLSMAIVEVCLGEIEQIKDKYRFDQTLRDYLRRIKRKTALLIAVSCKIGAIAGETEESLYQELYQFGYYIGMAYQITDDILDFTGTEKELGKPAGEDLRQGNITLPALYAMRQKDIKERIVQITDQTSREEMEAVIKLIKSSGAVEEAHQLSARYLQKALSILDGLPNHQAKRSLLEIAHFIGRRKY